MYEENAPLATSIFVVNILVILLLLFYNCKRILCFIAHLYSPISRQVFHCATCWQDLCFPSFVSVVGGSPAITFCKRWGFEVFDSRSFLRSNCWVQPSQSHMVLPAVQEIVGCPPTSSFCRLPRQLEFSLMLCLRWSFFAKGGCGLTCANKTREAQVLSAGNTMKYLPWKREVQMD